MSSKDIHFEVKTPLNRRIRTTREYWGFIVKVEHPTMRERERDVAQTLREPDFVRQSKCIFITAGVEISLSVSYADI